MKKMYPIETTQHLQQWGNSAGVRLPKRVITAAHLKINQPLKLSMQGRSIVLTPIEPDKKVTLDSMLEGVTPEAVAGEYEWGEDVGAERYE